MRLRDPETGKTFNYKKREIVFSEISLCANAPIEYRDRQTLWTSVQRAEKNSNAQLAREIEVALPREFSREQQITVLREYISEHFTSAGMICDWSIHDKPGNTHAHLLLTMRPIKEDGTWGAKKRTIYEIDPDTGERIPVIDPKTGQQKKDQRNRIQWKRITVPSTNWNSPEAFQRWRASWADLCNKELEKMGSSERISEKSYAAQGILRQPTIHEGPRARLMEKRGLVSELCAMNREIRQRNALLTEIRDRMAAIQVEISKLLKARGRAIMHIFETIGDKGINSHEIDR